MAGTDVNSDGNIDMVIASPGGIGVLLSNGKGGLLKGPLSSSLSCARTGVFADFTGDGKLDLIAGDSLCGGGMALQAGEYGGEFGDPVRISASSDPLAVGDFNGDNRPDVVSYRDYSSFVVLLNNGRSVFVQGPEFPLPAGGPVVVGDVNRDGHQDIVVGQTFGSPSIYVLLGNGTGALRRGATLNAGRVDLLAPGDFNRDGNPDLIQVNSENDVANFITFVGAGDGTFRPARRYGLPMLPNVTAVAHLNRDDFPDIIFAGRGQTLVSVGNGDAAFTNISGPATIRVL
jgi:hypothetical protein